MFGLTMLDHLGPFTTKPPVQALLLLTQRIWEQFHSGAGGQSRSITNEREYFATRMMHISEVMSLSLRLNASWGLTHAAMSLLRDRYEQAVRFSWLARQPNDEEHKKYLLYFYAKARSLMRDPSRRDDFQRTVGPLPQWVIEPLTKEQQEQFRAWESLDLRSMATKRDSLQRLTELPIGHYELAPWYDSIYAQFSSVSHFDMYSLELIQLHEEEPGHFVMDTASYWPGLLILQNCVFDIVQCFEALQAYFAVDAAQHFNGLLAEWLGLASRMEYPRDALPRMPAAKSEAQAEA